MDWWNRFRARVTVNQLQYFGLICCGIVVILIVAGVLAVPYQIGKYFAK